jgi:hypothetical protein
MPAGDAIGNRSREMIAFLVGCLWMCQTASCSGLVVSPSSFGVAGWDTDDNSEARGLLRRQGKQQQVSYWFGRYVMSCDKVPDSSKKDIASCSRGIPVRTCMADGHGECHRIVVGLVLLMRTRPARTRILTLSILLDPFMGPKIIRVHRAQWMRR